MSRATEIPSEGEPLPWEIFEWVTLRRKPLRREEIIPQITRGSRQAPTVLGMLKHAEISYLACRILFLASKHVHPAALYMAAQAIEKHLKAVLLARGKRYTTSHDIVGLARLAGGEFLDPEFTAVCEDLRDFQVAGRYDDGHDLETWTYSIDLLALLDVFAYRCRALIPRTEGYRNAVAALLNETEDENEVMRAAKVAVRDCNVLLEYLTVGSRTEPGAPRVT